MALGDWKIDPSLKRQRPGEAKGGSPPEGHPRRCQGVKRNGRQCGQWAAADNERPFCKRHSGGKKKFHLPKTNIYTRRATKAFADVLMEFKQDDDSLASLEAEIEVSRCLAAESVKLFDEAHYGPKADSVSEDAKDTARRLVSKAMREVSALLEKHAKIKALKGNTFNPDQVEQLLVQVSRIIEKHVPAEALPTAMKEIEDLKFATRPDKTHLTIQI